MKWLTATLLVIAAVLAALLVLRAFNPPALTGGTALDTPLAVPATSLVNDRGQATTLAASDGRLRLVFFGYARCPDVCPLTLSNLSRVYKTLTPEQKKRVQVQLVSVDPVYDTPNVLREYLDKFDADFTGLTGTPTNIDAAARALFVSNVVEEPADHSGHETHSDHDQNAPVSALAAARIHGDEVRIIDPQGQFVRVYNNSEAMDGTLERDLPGLIRTYDRRS